jgi:photosynthetic reaction center cytochrome c subunit
MESATRPENQRPSDRQIAIFVSVAVGAIVAIVTTATFYWIYNIVARDDPGREAAAAESAPWNLNDGTTVITEAEPNQPTDGREPWLGLDAWREGSQAGQQWAAEYPNTINVQVLTGMTSSQVWAYMQQYVSPALGVGCQYCHNINNFASDEYPQKLAARSMLRLVGDLNEQHITNLPNWKGNYVQCATCHFGQPVAMEAYGQQFQGSVPPINVVVDPLDADGQPILDPAQKPADIQTPLPLQDAIVWYVRNYEVWKPFDPNVAESGRGSLALTLEGGRTQDQVTINQNVMNYMGWSQGVGCTFCHNSRNFIDYELETASNLAHPEYGYNKLKAQRMLLLTTWLYENWPQYGATGYDTMPVGAGAASEYSYANIGGKFYNLPACYTCHAGYSIPRGSMPSVTIDESTDPVTVLPPVLRGQ